QLCLLCSEKVFDATTLSDNELNKLVSQKDRPKCMKFKQSQLNRPLLVSSNHFNYKQISNAFYGLLVAGLVVSCSSHGHKKVYNNDPQSAFIIDPIQKDILFFTVEGIVVESKQNKPVANAEVSFVDTNFKVLTDDRGHFDFLLSSNFLKDEMSLEVRAGGNNLTHVGYTKFAKNDLPKLDTIKVESIEMIILGYYEVEN
ncbi:MAG: hypothetical protein RSD71_18700, partial [Flavobacterium sp.]